MSQFIPWDSQPLDMWAKKHAPGHFDQAEDFNRIVIDFLTGPVDG